MNKKNLIISIFLIIIICVSLITTCIYKNKDNKTLEKNILEATIVSSDNTSVTVKNDNGIYTFKIDDLNIDNGSKIIIEYTGLLNKDKELQDVSIINYRLVANNNNTNILNDNGIFSKYYPLASETLKGMTLDEKIAQLLLVRYDSSIDLTKHQLGGIVFFSKDFQNKTEQEVKDMIKNLQKQSKIPLLTASDEEGGTVTRISTNPNLASEKFKSPRQLYQLGGFEKIKEDTINKSNILNNLGINVNLAPVVDVATNPSDYMYNRSLGEDTAKTSEFAKTVIEASKGHGVSYTLKHFPGYGNNNDTHNNVVNDNRDRDDIFNNDIPPFKAGIEAGAEAILVSHNVVTNIDATNPASLSPTIHSLLRNDLDFTGIIMTDDINMGGVNSSNPAVDAIIAGNDLIITTDYLTDITNIKQAIDDGTISENDLDEKVIRVLAWKYYKGLFDNK